MTFDLIFGIPMQIQTWHPPPRLCMHAKYYVKSGLTNVLKNANKTKNMHLFSIWIANYKPALNVRPSPARQQNTIKWPASSFILLDHPGKIFWIRACISSLHMTTRILRRSAYHIHSSDGSQTC